MRSLRVFENKRYKDPTEFVCPPSVGFLVSEGDALAHVTVNLTAKTGAELRSLADHADQTWADYVAYVASEGVAP